MAQFPTYGADHAPPSRSSRVLAACAYVFGACALIVIALNPNRPFLVRHAQLAMIIHVLRFLLVGTAIVAWYSGGGPGGSTGDAVAAIALHLGTLTLFGTPWPWLLDRDLLLTLGLPLGGPWVLAIAGAMLSGVGLTIDFRAMVSSVWPDRVDDSVPDIGTPEYYRRLGFSVIAPIGAERDMVRGLRDRRLERMWNASRVAALERNRDTIRQELELRQSTVLGRLDYLNHLLSSGEISMSRFNRLHQELVTYLEQLRVVRAQVQSRSGESAAIEDFADPPDALTGAPDARVLSLAVIDRSGMPIVSYGHFALDESLISGMVSVIDGLSEEMFGSRASKTHLAGGAVAHFVYGTYTTVLTTFDDEPAPVQITRLGEYLDEFEAVNREQLQASPVDASAIAAVEVPFRFKRASDGANDDPWPVAQIAQPRAESH